MTRRRDLTRIGGLLILTVAVLGGLSPAAGAPGTSSTASHLVVTSREIDNPVGRILTDSRGRVLYLYTRDVDGRSHCTGACRSAWPAAASTGSPRAGTDVEANKLDLTNSGQVTYHGHPLYYDASDTTPGRHSGEGAHVDGGRFYLVTTTGHALKPVDCASPGSLCGTASS